MRGLDPYRRPSLAHAVGLAPATAAAIPILGIEVTQAIQTVRNTVPLIAAKPTVVRIYLDTRAMPSAATLTGELAWRRAGGGGVSYLPAFNRIRVDPQQPLDLTAQRHQLDASVAFRLPDAAVTTGRLELRLNRVNVHGGADLPTTGQASATVEFRAAPTLRIRAIGLRYRVGESENSVAPSAVHFAYFRSYLRRAYPVASVDWSHTVVDANFRGPFTGNTVLRANAQVAAIRSRDVSTGVDARTHYYGLVDDNAGEDGYFMRGQAQAIPGVASPDVVASGPVGVPGGFAGDLDASYADWYGAHELGHTFGRFHPGFPPFDPATGTGQDRSDTDFPYPDGRITTGDDAFVGFDVGDIELNLPMRVLAGNTHHDVMTYKPNQWLSEYTYKAILARLVAEEALGP
jgi:hypothetical protein